MEETFQYDSAAKALAAAWHAGTQQSALRELVRPPSINDAYTVQDGLVARMNSPVVGWKIGMAGRNAYGRAGLARPLFGAIPASRFYRSGDIVPVPQGVAVTVELELALVIARDVEPGTPVTADSVGSAHLGFEIVSSRLPDRKTIGVAATVADNAVSHAVVLGDSIDLDRFNDILSHANVSADSVLSTIGLTGDDLPEPFAVLGHLVAHLAERGRRLRAGDTVFTGTLTKPFEVIAPCLLSGGSRQTAVTCQLAPST